MKKSRSILVQIALWLSLWSVFSFSGDASNKLPFHYVSVALRVLSFALFYNIAYYWLLPRYFTGKKRLFYFLSPLLFVAYLGYSIVFDLYVSTPEKTMKLSPEMKNMMKKKRPLSYLLIPPIFISLSLFGVAASLRGFAAFENKKQAEEEANRRRLEAEIALLKSQINPHFLVNTLNNLYALSLAEPGKTPGALLKLSEMVGYLLYECAKTQVALADDILFIKNYIDLQKLRLSPNIELITELPEELPLDVLIEPMILIPFIENAFKHGLTTKQPCRILVSLTVDGKRLRLIVENPVYPGKQPHHNHPSGIGMTNTRQRLEHSYPERYTLSVDKDEHFHKVVLEMKL